MQTIDFSKRSALNECWELLQQWDYLKVTPKAVMEAFWSKGIRYYEAQQLAKRFNQMKGNIRKPDFKFPIVEDSWN